MASNSPAPFGAALRPLFLFDKDWRNLNHGSFGATPREIKDRQIQDLMRSESVPDKYIRYDYPRILDAAREAIAKHLNAPADTIVLVPNATTAVNVVLRNMTWSADGKDDIISFSTIYGACGKTIDYIIDTSELVSSRVVPLTYPMEDAAVVDGFRAAVAASREQGRRPRIAVFDTVTSMPGVRFPFEEVTKACRELGVLSLVDGAQGVGMLHLDLAALDADFFLSNCHKWLYVPKGCAVLYVPLRHQSSMTSSLPTSHGYVPKKDTGRNNPLPREAGKSQFVENFQFVGTIENSAFACVGHALEWRQRVLGGEEHILAYLWSLAKEGGRKAAEILGTEVIDNTTGTLTNCAMVNVWLPVRTGSFDRVTSGPDGVLLPAHESLAAIAWASKVLVDEHNTFLALAVHNNRWFMRLSAQVYVDLDDFEWAARLMKTTVERIGREEFKSGGTR
ncbi:hypothetical protein CDD83_2889 [Cordyceps sp. RAO-2017]|nr:hypothetical protein CDD83_2889 [Cordyceps sp. RAO-2017]